MENNQTEFELKFCETCCQMKNHIKDVCQKCAKGETEKQFKDSLEQSSKTVLSTYNQEDFEKALQEYRSMKKSDKYK